MVLLRFYRAGIFRLQQSFQSTFLWFYSIKISNANSFLRRLQSLLILHFKKSLNYLLPIFRWARLWHLNYQASSELQGANLNPCAFSASCAIHLRGDSHVTAKLLSGKIRAKLVFSTVIPFSEPYHHGEYVVISKWECDFFQDCSWGKKIHSIC